MDYKDKSIMQIIEEHLSPVSVTGGASSGCFIGGTNELGSISRGILDAVGEGFGGSSNDIRVTEPQRNSARVHRKNMKIMNDRFLSGKK